VRPAWRDPDDCVRGRYPPPRFDTFSRRRRNRRRRRPPGPTDRDRMDGEQISFALGRQFPRQRAGMATHTPSASRHRATGSAQTWV
jgi:hypothetical protein